MMQTVEVLVHGNHYGSAQLLQYFGHLQGWKHLQSQVQNRMQETKVQKQLFRHSELFGSGWKPLAKNRALEAVIEELGGKIDRVRKDLQKCADLVLRKDNTLLVVELMRPGLAVDTDHINRVLIYQTYLAGYLKTYSVKGLLIADETTNPGALNMLNCLPSNDIQFITWQQFIQMTKPELRLEAIQFLDNTVNQIAGLLPPSPGTQLA